MLLGGPNSVKLLLKVETMRILNEEHVLIDDSASVQWLYSEKGCDW